MWKLLVKCLNTGPNGLVFGPLNTKTLATDLFWPSGIQVVTVFSNDKFRQLKFPCHQRTKTALSLCRSGWTSTCVLLTTLTGRPSHPWSSTRTVRKTAATRPRAEVGQVSRPEVSHFQSKVLPFPVADLSRPVLRIDKDLSVLRPSNAHSGNFFEILIFFNTHLGYCLLLPNQGGMPPPSGGILGKNQSTRSKTTVSSLWSFGA